MSNSSEKPSIEDMKLPAAITDLSRKLEKEFTVGDGSLVNPDKDAITRVLPEESVKVLSEAQKIYSDLTSATALAFHNVSHAYMKKNKSVERVELHMPVLRDKIEGTYDRSKISRSPVPGSEPTTKYGILNMSLTVNGTVNQRGHLKKIRAYASDLAAHELAK